MLFVDLVGSTALAARCPPTDVVALLNRFFSIVVDVVEEHGGGVNKFEGDAALCVFGAPVPRDDPAGAALCCARLLADRLAYKVGEAAEVNLHSRVPAGPALIAWEADRVIQYRIVDLKEGDNPLTWAVEGPQFPNFTLTAARMSSGRFAFSNTTSQLR